MEIFRGLRNTLQVRPSTSFELYSEFLDTVRFPDPDLRRRLVDTISAKYRNVSFDLVFAVGPGALHFLLDNRDTVAKGAPIIFGGVSNETLESTALPKDVHGVISRFDVRKTVELAAHLHPSARKLVVLTGSAPFDQEWEVSARRDLGDRYGGFDVDYLSGLSLEGFKDAASKLPTETVLLILTVFKDADGRSFIPRDAATAIAAVSSVPSYAVYSTYVGLGVVGGHIETFDSIGAGMAKLAAQLESDPTSVPATVLSVGLPVIDWRQSRRWGINDALLPKDADVRYYEPSPFEKYRLELLTGLTVVLLQSATIAALIVQNRRNRRTKSELALERLELAHLSRASQLGELSGAFAHELNQPLTSILANAEAGIRLVRANPVDTSEINEIFSDIITDDKRAAETIAQLRKLIVKGETSLIPLDLNEAVAATVKLVRGELVARQTEVDFRPQQDELPVRGNLAQLQQIIINLLLNAAEAMSRLPPSERRIAIRTRRRNDGSSELAVSDRGPGVSPDMMANAFKPFVSTKETGLGLGLAITKRVATNPASSIRRTRNVTGQSRRISSFPT